MLENVEYTILTILNESHDESAFLAEFNEKTCYLCGTTSPIC